MPARSGPYPMTLVSAGVNPVLTPLFWGRGRGAVTLPVHFVHFLPRAVSSG